MEMTVSPAEPGALVTVSLTGRMDTAGVDTLIAIVPTAVETHALFQR